MKKPKAKSSPIRARQKARTRETIIKAGIKVFADKGFYGATMDDIALELDATKGLLYYHFKTKQEILQSILTESELISGLAAGMLAPQGLPLADALALAMTRSLELMESNREVVRFLQVQALLSGTSAEEVFRAILRRLYDDAARWIEQFKVSGEVRPEVDSHSWGRLWIDFLTSYLLRRDIFGETGQAKAEYLGRALEMLVCGIGTERAKATALAAGARRNAQQSDDS